MDLLSDINNCTEEEIDLIIRKALKELNDKNSNGKILGFGESQSMLPLHKGFIAKNDRIKYSNIGMESYSMKTEDYFYEFAHAIRKHRITKKGQLVGFIESFINSYFGFVKYNYDARSKILNDEAWQSTSTDEEYFEKLENNEIGDLKGKGVAMCTERSAIAQNLLSLFGFETYYCMGSVNNNGIQEAHCFNLAKAKEKFIIIDYSIPSPMILKGKTISYLPFQGEINFSEIDGILNTGISKTFSSYEWLNNGNEYKKVLNGKERSYVIGKFELEQDKQSSNHL